MRDQNDFTMVMQRYSDTVWRACAVYLHQRADIEDAFQDTFVKYATNKPSFNDEEHRKAWLIRTATNTCKDLLKRSERKTVPVDSFDDTHVPINVSGSNGAEGFYESSDDDVPDVLAALRKLDERYRIPLYLTYYERLTAAEVGEILDQPVNTVYTNLARGRAMLKEVLSSDRT